MGLEQDVDNVKRFTKSKLIWLMKMQAEGKQKDAFARLRKGIGKVPGEDPLLWGSFLDGMPEEMYTQNGDPSYAEWSVYNALTLFSLHQQGKDIAQECMHQEGRGLGNAMAKLIEGPEDNERITRRFNTVATSADMKEMAYHLRGVVQLLRSKAIPLDYVDLAGNIYRFQFQGQREKVRLKWGQDFYRIINRQNNTKGKGETDE